MKRWYITFSGQGWNNTTEKIVKNAPALGADEVLVYDDKWLEGTEFCALNHWLWEHHGDSHNVKRGFGWFCWKPYILMHCLEHFMSDGDVVLFTDGDTYPIGPLQGFYDTARDAGAMFFKAQGCSNRQWVKSDCRIVMGLDPLVRAHWMPPAVHIETDHATARFIAIKRGPWKPRQLLIEWQAYCLNPLATTFEPSVIYSRPEAEGFQEHRTEQAILTLLIHKYGYPMHREACQFGNAALKEYAEDSWYPQTFVQEWGSGPREVGPGSKYRNVEAALARIGK